MIADRLAIEPEAVAPLLRIARAKLARAPAPKPPKTCSRYSGVRTRRVRTVASALTAGSDPGEAMQ